jgi:hypothetical protein
MHLISFFFNCFHSRHLHAFVVQMQLISDVLLREAPSVQRTLHFAPETGAPKSQSSVTGGITLYNSFSGGHSGALVVVVSLVVVTTGAVVVAIT